MKFLLVLHVCSLLTKTCPNMMYPREIYDSHFDCAIAGYTQAKELMLKMPKNLVNESKVAIKFECKEFTAT